MKVALNFHYIFVIFGQNTPIRITHRIQGPFSRVMLTINPLSFFFLGVLTLLTLIVGWSHGIH